MSQFQSHPNSNGWLPAYGKATLITSRFIFATHPVQNLAEHQLCSDFPRYSSVPADRQQDNILNGQWTIPYTSFSNSSYTNYPTSDATQSSKLIASYDQPYRKLNN